MKSILPRQPDFLRRSFPSIRKRLGGPESFQEYTVDHFQASSQEVTIFDGPADLEKLQNRAFSGSLAAFLGDWRGKASVQQPGPTPEPTPEPAQEPVWETVPPPASYQPAAATDFGTADSSVDRTYEIYETYQAASSANDSIGASQAPIQVPAQAPTPISTSTQSKAFKRAVNIILSIVISFSLLLGVVMVVPAAYYSIFPADVIEIEPPEPGTAFGGEFKTPRAVETVAEPVVQKYEPPIDPTLPEGDWLIIPRIGVRTPMQPTEDPEEALATGIWWVPDFGGPGYDELPMILAGHRYGWKWWWRDDYWKYHSFNLLPNTEPGDRIEIISGQRKWIYEIYAGEEGDEITDYDADLILYTCKFLTGPIRHFRYARIIDPTANTQAVSGMF